MRLTQIQILEASKDVVIDGPWVRNWFSNMLPLDEPITHERISYFTVENFYQAMKIEARRRELRVEIAAMNPHASKRCFRDEPDRFQVRSDFDCASRKRYMRCALEEKFKPGTSWHEKLIATGDEPIIEFNNWGDVFWGWDIKKQRGTNNLGKMLMEIRERFTRIELEDFMA